MEDAEEYKKLPVEEKCVHKLWKARVQGYEEVTKLFRQIDDEKSSEFGKYLGLVKKFVIDSNAVGQEKGLDAVLAYVENYAHAGKTVNEVMSGIVTKCIAAPKTRTRELAVQLTLMYIEIEKQDAVQEELIRGMEQKNPKIVSACVNACTTALREFGTKIFNPKALIKKIGPLFADRDKAVRDEARLMVIELYRWIGPALKTHLQSANLQAVQLAELESVFSKMEGQKASPMRYIRSQQQKQAKMAAEAVEVDGGEGDEEDPYEAPQDIDPYDLADPVDVLSKMPKDFYEKVEAKKWQERKEAIEAVETLLKTPKLESGDYGDLVRALKKAIQKDSNVMVVALAGKCLASLAAGLKKRFQIYSGTCVSALLEKFKERKQNVVVAIREAIDAVYLTTTFEAVLEDVIEALNNKNPNVKSETSLFLARAFTKTLPTSVNKKLLKAITAVLTKNLNDPDPTVRESTAEAIGTLMKLVGEKAIAPFLVELEKDNLKMQKIKECCDKAVITVKAPGAKKERPATAPAKAAARQAANGPETRSAGATAPKAVKKPAGAGQPKKRQDASAGSAMTTRSKAAVKSSSKAAVKQAERELSDEEVDEIIAGVLSASVITDLSNANWKSRLASAEQILTEVSKLDPKSIPSQAVVRTLAKRPGLKDTNFQVLKVKFDIVRYVAEKASTFSTATLSRCLSDVAEKLGDPKNGAPAGETLTAMAEATSLGHVSTGLMELLFTQKSPKVQQEGLLWTAAAIKEFGFSGLNAKLLIDNSKKALASSNPSIRQAAITLLGTMYLYMGATLNVFFENEKAALRDLINAEFDKYEGEKPPPPTRGVVKSESTNSLDDLDDEEGSAEPEVVNVQDLIPRVDISAQITDALINELTDKNWKVRNEALTKVSAIIGEAKFIKSNLGELPQALAARLTDSNMKIAQAALNICESLAKAMGPPCKQYVRTFFPGFLAGLGDSKLWMRATALETIAAFSEQCGYKEFFDGEMIGDALKSGSPTLRIELWNWLAEVLPKVPVKSVPKEELQACVPHLFSNLEDRNADVRKNATEAILGIMIHLGYESMAKQTEKLKPGSRSVVMAALEKVRPNLPERPLPKKASAEKEDKAIRGGQKAAGSKQNLKPKSASSKTSMAAQPSAKKKDEDIDTSPLLVINNLKHQRTIDESKLKVLKWNFTAPREEFVDLLKDQMTAANVNRTLVSNMFHSDFRFHIKAIESLMDDLPGNGPALISNLDLILKWLTLRFFDTNPSVLLKGLEYLHSVFNMLIETKYHMLENEASSFIPYLVLKIGDPKDTVRNGVRSLLKQISKFYAVGRLFNYVMDGVKSKNARQRAECLEVMGNLIEDYGINVCYSPAACLKEVAKQISDRDNSVRNAALNCVVQAYNIVGEKVYKMVGGISDKDMTLLEERIKRASRRTISKPVAPEPNSTIVHLSPHKEINGGSPHKDDNRSPQRGNCRNDEDDDDDDVEDEENLPPVMLPPQIVIKEPPKKEVTGPFKLDEEFIRDLEKRYYTSPPKRSELLEFDLAFLKEEIKIPSLSDTAAKVMPLSPPEPILPGQLVPSGMGPPPYSDIPKKRDASVERVIAQMTSTTITECIKAIAEMQDILNSNRGDTIAAYEDDFMSAIIKQFKFLRDRDPIADPSISKIYRGLLTSLDSFYRKNSLGRQVSLPVLKDLLNQLICLLVDEKLEKCGEAYVRVINVNCVKILERSDHTSIICALVKLIHECITLEAQPRQVDLVMKCLWKVIKLMPSWGSDIDYSFVLLEVHLFLKEYPSSWWKQQKQVDTPLRTVKTILHSSVKIKGTTIMLYLNRIPDKQESEVENYILRLLKTLKITESQGATTPQKPMTAEQLQQQLVHRRPLSRENHNTLTEIFQKIGRKEETHDGLDLLYDFVQRHPDTDMEPFLRKSSKFFQDYIRNGLKEIESLRKNARASITAKVNETNESDAALVALKGPEYYDERLKMWEEVWEKVKNGGKVPDFILNM